MENDVPLFESSFRNQRGMRKRMTYEDLPTVEGGYHLHIGDREFEYKGARYMLVLYYLFPEPLFANAPLVTADYNVIVMKYSKRQTSG